ncbi:MAG: acetyltransferase [Candidatus Omnitrophota bacterium]
MPKKEKIFIVGAGGHARSLMNALELSGFSILGLYDESCKKRETINGRPLVGSLAAIKSEDLLTIAAGDNQRRERLYRRYYRQILKKNVIHPTAQIEAQVSLGECNQILAQAFINSNVQIGNNNLINTRATIEHEVRVGDHCHISVGAIICGRVSIGDRCFIGAGAVIIDKIVLCDDVLVGANAVVIHDIKKPGTYVGNPARKVK